MPNVQQDLFKRMLTALEQERGLMNTQDLVVIAQRKLSNLRQKLLNIPVQDINQIMELNQQIHELEVHLESLSHSDG